MLLNSHAIGVGMEKRNFIPRLDASVPAKLILPAVGSGQSFADEPRHAGDGGKSADQEGGGHAARFDCRACNKPSAVTFPPDARMMFSIASMERFWLPRRMREIEASLIGGVQREPNSAAVTPSVVRY